MTKKRSLAAVVILAVVVGILTTYLGIRKVNRARRQAEVMSRFHFLAKILEVYVADHHAFPESLETMMKAAEQDMELLVPIEGERIEYKRPGLTDPSSTPVLIVVGNGFKVVVRKDFERRQDRQGSQ